jgi:ABC-type transporter Mla subunit MlaD
MTIWIEWVAHLWRAFASEPGTFVADSILGLANLVAAPAFPGYVSGAFFLTLLALIFTYGRGARAAIRSINNASRIVQAAGDRAAFWQQFLDIDKSLRAHESSKSLSSRRRSISRAWHEFHETLILPEGEDSRGYVRNTIRPHAFFNKDDLGFESQIWRQVPGLFVSLGLFFTFLGLIAALNSAGSIFEASATPGQQADGMKTLLTVASAKFIMSLSGLASSILFNLGHKVMSAYLDNSILRFCDGLELRMQYLTPEGLSMEQLETIKDQTQQLKAFNADLAAQVGRALETNTDAVRNELPKRISQSLKEEIAPLLDRIGQESTENVGGMVRDLGAQLHENLNSSLSEIATTLGGVNAALSNLSQELGNSGTNVSNEINGAVSSLSATMDQIRDSMTAMSGSAAETMQQGSDSILEAMNRTLSAIESNTKESAGALSDAAKELVSAAGAMGQQVRETADEAGAEVRAGIEATGQELVAGMSGVSSSVLEEADRFKSALDHTISQPLDDLASAMERLGSQLRSSAGAIESHKQAVEGAASATATANEALADGSRNLVDAAAPIKASVQNIETANRRMAEALKESAAAIAGNRQVVEQSLQSLEAAVAEFNTVTSRYDEIDQKLGVAFQTITNEVEAASNQVRKYATDIESNFSRGINSLVAAIDGAADFTPPGN